MPYCKNDSKKKYKGTEPSPKGLGYCAHASNINIKKKGKDGNIWIVKKIKNGTKRWIKYNSSKETSKEKSKKHKKSIKTKPSERTSYKKDIYTLYNKKKIVNVKSKKHNIIFCEPSTYTGPGLFVSDVIKVTPGFYSILQKNPKRKTCKDGNSYIFGNTYNLSDYKYIDSHDNDIAQTGFIDVDIWNKKDENNIHKALKGRYDWDNKKTIREVKKAVPSVIWFGTTDGGNMGANLYAHYNKKKEIDGFIIDNNCLFPSIK